MGGGQYFRGAVTFRIYQGPQKIDVNFGGSLLSGFVINKTLRYNYKVKRKGYKNQLNDPRKGNVLIFYQILLTNSLRKGMEVSLENLKVGIGS